MGWDLEISVAIEANDLAVVSVQAEGLLQPFDFSNTLGYRSLRNPAVGVVEQNVGGRTECRPLPAMQRRLAFRFVSGQHRRQSGDSAENGDDAPARKHGSPTAHRRSASLQPPCGGDEEPAVPRITDARSARRLRRTIIGGQIRSSFSRRRVITILGAVAGLPPVLSRDKPRSETPPHRWQGTALGSPSYILLHHPDRRVAERAVAQCVAEIERLEQSFSLYRGDSEIVRLNCDGYL